MKRFNVVIPVSSGGVGVYPMKEWLRQHPDHIPAGLDGTLSTSHALRNGLKKLGWKAIETPTEVRLMLPGAGAAEIQVESVPGDDDELPDGDSSDSEARFGLEYQLRDFIGQNLDVIKIDGRRLRLDVDPTGRDGIEYPTAVGPIDILAVDDSEAIVVFELKRAHSPDKAIGQLARYMGWVTQTIGRGRNVRGVIVAKQIGENLRYAVSVFPNVSLFEYEVEFHLKPAQDLPQVIATGG